ncbi:MAG: phosphoadenylyl-sulfate reductase [Myxococcales bacterium]|nr:phosphoadenylyl-sulfate reductase [Myxococcales bacterium]
MDGSPSRRPDETAVRAWNRDLTDQTAEGIVRWAGHTFGDGLVLSSSFGAHAAVMLHLVTTVLPKIPVIFIDTGYLFPETYRFAHKLAGDLNLNLHVFTPHLTTAHQEAIHGRRWEQGEHGVQEYLRENKLEPMRRALHDLGATAWLSGVRAEQSEHRSNLATVEIQDGRHKVHPILHWSDADVESYLQANDLPHHPLYEDGYRSIGDTHSTLPTVTGQHPREGRILGKKRECGLHVSLSGAENDSRKSSGL